MQQLLFGVILLAIVSAGMVVYYQLPRQSDGGPIACTMEAKICPDGTAVGRTGPNCEFAECPAPVSDPNVPPDVKAHIDAHANLIVLESPKPLEIIRSPLTVTGRARGMWFFEATFPVVLVNWDGLVIGQGYATADGEWMTEEFVPFTATIEFDEPEFDERGALILQKDNPSGLPENDDALEIPIRFEQRQEDAQRGAETEEGLQVI